MEKSNDKEIWEGRKEMDLQGSWSGVIRSVCGRKLEGVKGHIQFNMVDFRMKNPIKEIPQLIHIVKIKEALVPYMFTFCKRGSYKDCCYKLKLYKRA